MLDRVRRLVVSRFGPVQWIVAGLLALTFVEMFDGEMPAPAVACDRQQVGHPGRRLMVPCCLKKPASLRKAGLAPAAEPW